MDAFAHGSELSRSLGWNFQEAAAAGRGDLFFESFQSQTTDGQLFCTMYASSRGKQRPRIMYEGLNERGDLTALRIPSASWVPPKPAAGTHA